MRRFLFPVLFGVGGCAILIALGVWQLQRHTWKTALLAEINTRIAAPPVELPWKLDPVRDRYLSVKVTGQTTGEEADVLTSTAEQGPGFRIISQFETGEGRLVLVDEGFVPEAAKTDPRPPVKMSVTGNLAWPDEVDSFTPDPDLDKNFWYARDVPRIARELGAEPVLIVARDIGGAKPRATPMPIDTSGIPNNHLGYAIQWFGMAAVWAGMTLILLWRIHRRTV